MKRRRHILKQVIRLLAEGDKLLRRAYKVVGHPAGPSPRTERRGAGSAGHFLRDFPAVAPVSLAPRRESSPGRPMGGQRQADPPAVA